MSGGFIPSPFCRVDSGDCWVQGKCIGGCGTGAKPLPAEQMGAEQLLVLAAKAQRKAQGPHSKIAKRIDEMLAAVRRGDL